MRKKSKIPYLFLLFFIIVLLVDGTFILISQYTHSGLVTTHPYEKGRQYNKVLSKNFQQEHLGWNVSVFIEQIPSNSQHVKVTIIVLDRDNKYIKDASINAKIIRTVTSKYDIEFNVPYNEDMQVYTTKVDLPLLGLWELRALISLDGEEYFVDKRFTLK